MTTFEELQAHIVAFVSPETRSHSEHGSLAQVANTDIGDLRRIVNLLLELKYEADASGGRPISVYFLDRTKFEGALLPHYRHVPYDGDRKDYERILQANIRNASGVIAQASTKLSQWIHELEDLTKDQEEGNG
jgi:hypothetical protein